MDATRRAALVSYLLLSLTSLFWSGNVVLGLGVIDQIPPLGLTFWRWVGALVIMLPFSWRTIVEHRAAIRRDWKMLSLLGLLGIVCFNSFSYIAFQTTTAINASLINTLLPIMIIAMAIVGFRETMGLRRAIGLVVSLVGTLVILTRGDSAVLGSLARHGPSLRAGGLVPQDLDRDVTVEGLTVCLHEKPDVEVDRSAVSRGGLVGRDGHRVHTVHQRDARDVTGGHVRVE